MTVELPSANVKREAETSRGTVRSRNVWYSASGSRPVRGTSGLRAGLEQQLRKAVEVTSELDLPT
jgi:hypothetical protein